MEIIERRAVPAARLYAGTRTVAWSTRIPPYGNLPSAHPTVAGITP
jgi:hypothetical protein